MLVSISENYLSNILSLFLEKKYIDIIIEIIYIQIAAKLKQTVNKTE